MANPTVVDIQTALGDTDNGEGVTIVEARIGSTATSLINALYVRGGEPKQGVTRWIDTATDDTAATQAAAILANLAVG